VKLPWRSEAEQFAQFILRIYQLVQKRCFPFYGGTISLLTLLLHCFLALFITLVDGCTPSSVTPNLSQTDVCN